MEGQGIDGLFDELVADAFDRRWPVLTPRSARLPWLKGKVDVVVGMRRTGKTTFVFQVAQGRVASGRPRESIFYVSFDDERLAPMTAGHLSRLVESYYRRWPNMRDTECTFLFDEIQNISGWEQFVRRLVDSENVHICLTGSSAKLLSTEVATSMRGRAMTTELFPFSFLESLAHAGIAVSGKRPGKRLRSQVESHFDRFLHVGGFPEAQGLEEHHRVQLLQGYLDAVILRDVVERHAISNPTALRRFVRQLMNAPGGLVSIHRIYNDLRSQGVSVSKDALHAFIDHLTDAYLFMAVPVDSESERVRQSNPRKVYCIDPGMVTACTHKSSHDTGFLLETVVFMTLRRRTRAVTYLRTSDGAECDFVIRGSAGVELVQACADLGDEATRDREVAATTRAMEALKVRKATIVTLRHESLIRTRVGQIRIVPAWLWALEQER